ncbi:MAG: hypothetical protein JSU63_15245 [Phycisphaerales bacterium]|nr:MAG: hypothetical protein JSU63_15245 [Phycisphaerales bacterium]
MTTLDDTSLTQTQSCCETGEVGARSLDEILSTIERREILGALRRANGQRTQAARLLGISRSRLYRRMEALGIDPRNLGSSDAV